MESTPRQSGEAEDIAKLLARCHDVEQRVESLLLVNDELVRQAALTADVTAAIIASLGVGNWRHASATLLRHALKLTQSEYGFIGFVLVPGRLRVLAHEGVVWDQTTSTNREFYENTLNAYTEVGYLEFPRLDNLFGRVIASGNTILSNDAAHDPLSSGRLPPGHPPLRQFLGVPAKHQGEVVGMIGIANRDGGYREYDQRQVEALSTIVGSLYASYGRHLRVSELEEQLRVSQARLVEVLEQREAIGRKIYDDTIQVLYSLGLCLDEIFRVCRIKNVEIHNSIEPLVDVINRMIGDIRLHLLRHGADGSPSPIAEQISALVEQVNGEQHPRYSVVVVPEAARQLTPEQQHQVLFIVQEILGGLYRHTQQSEITIHLNVVGMHAQMSVSQVQYGSADTAPMNRLSSHGLAAIQARAKVLDGTILLASPESNKVTVTLEFPLAVN